MIESIKTIAPQSSEISYPCLMKSSRSGNIWLMSSRFKGTVVSVGHTGQWEVGAVWNCIEMNNLSPYTGDVTLRNKQ